MLIRTQNGYGLVNISCVDEIEIRQKENDYFVIAHFTEAKEDLGKYSTEERALNAIYGIEGAYLSSTAIISNGDIFNPSHGYVPAARVYEMPPDEDLEENEEN